MSKFLRRDAVATEKLGLVWPPLPWKCPGCGVTYETHDETIATVDLELVMVLRELLRTAPLVIHSPGLANMPKSREALTALASVVGSDMAQNGPPAVFLCIRCDVANATAPVVVHVLNEGRTLCGMFGVPGEWPANHKWVRLTEAKDATCIVCRQMIGVREEG